MNKFEEMQAKDDEQYRKFFFKCRLNRSHSIDIPQLRERCFNIINAFYAHKGILSSERPTADHENYIQDEWHKYFHNYMSSYLLDLAVGIRTLEDILDQSSPKLTAEDDGQMWGDANGIKHKTLREACNKIIHAKEFTYSLRKLDTDIFYEDMEEEDYYPQPTHCLEGGIELVGEKDKNEWAVTIYVEELINSTLKYLSLCEQVQCDFNEPI